MRDPLEALVAVETPEQLELELALAGVGSRFCAYAIDMAWQAIVLIPAVVLAIVWFGKDEWSWSPERLVQPRPLVLALMALTMFLVNYGYFAAFELAWRGQTPGKRQFGLRVMGAGGFPLTPAASLLRNLLRAVDFLPFFYGVGCTAIFLGPREQRLGDLVAGTWVVREKRSRAAEPVLDSDREIAADFLSRRGELAAASRAGANARGGIEPDRLSALERALADHAARRRGLPPPANSAQFLAELADVAR